MTARKWLKPSDSLPAPSEIVDVILPSGTQAEMCILSGRLWTYPGESTYVYFEPVLWSPKPKEQPQ